MHWDRIPIVEWDGVSDVVWAADRRFTLLEGPVITYLIIWCAGSHQVVSAVDPRVYETTLYVGGKLVGNEPRTAEDQAAIEEFEAEYLAGVGLPPPPSKRAWFLAEADGFATVSDLQAGISERVNSWHAANPRVSSTELTRQQLQIVRSTMERTGRT